MNTPKTLLLIACGCVLIAIAIYLGAYMKQRHGADTNQASSMPRAKVMASPIPDGTYTVRIHSITTTSEDTAITFDHVTYFNGTEATSSAEHDVKCDGQPLLACVPTLTRGYYVRESGADSFTAPTNANTSVTLKPNTQASVNDLKNLVRPFDPVFDVKITDGNIVSITEKSPL